MMPIRQRIPLSNSNGHNTSLPVGALLNGGLRYYILDNEPSIWHSTHRDVHPTGATMDEMRNQIIDYATQIKAVDPNALIVGPEEWGWSGYFYSGYDQQYGSQHGWSFLPDRSITVAPIILPWLLSQLQDRRPVSAGHLHCALLPAGGEFSNDTQHLDAVAAQPIDALLVGSHLCGSDVDQ